MGGESIAKAPLSRTCRNMEFTPSVEAMLRGPHAAYMSLRSDAVPPHCCAITLPIQLWRYSPANHLGSPPNTQ